MGLIDKIKNSYDYHKVDKYTKRRVSQSQFESHDRRYYENAYQDGDYVNPQDLALDTSQPSRSSYKPSGWSFHDLLKNKKALTVATSQLKTSETYTYGGRG